MIGRFFRKKSTTLTFGDLDDVAVLVCPYVAKRERPVNVVIVDPAGDIQMLSGPMDHELENAGEPQILSLHRLLSDQPDLADLGPVAAGAAWQRAAPGEDWDYFSPEEAP